MLPHPDSIRQPHAERGAATEGGRRPTGVAAPRSASRLTHAVPYNPSYLHSKPDDHRLFTNALPAQTRVNEFSGHHPTPLSNAALQCSQLSPWEPIWMLMIQPLEQGLGGGFRRFLEPQQDFGPYSLKGIFASSPGVGLRILSLMSWPHFSLTPQFGELRQKLFQTFTPQIAPQFTRT